MPAQKTTRKTESPEVVADRTEFVNEVRLAGRLAAEPEERELPSGDRLVLLRVVVDRPPVAGERRRVDTMDCAVWTAKLRRKVARFHVDDVIEVAGAVRRRFYKAGAVTVSRVEVEVLEAGLIRRARTG